MEDYALRLIEVMITRLVTKLEVRVDCTSQYGNGHWRVTVNRRDDVIEP